MKKEIKNFPNYYVYDSGFIQGKRKSKLKGKITWDGYQEVILSDGNRRRSVRTHILVAEAFLNPVEGKPYINHKDGNKLNNALNNLEYVTVAENTRHAVKNGSIKTKGKSFSHLTYEEIKRIFSLHRDGKSYKEITNIFNLSCRPDYIGELLSGRKLGDITRELRSETIEITPQGGRE